jgi:hypothetical protein
LISIKLRKTHKRQGVISREELSRVHDITRELDWEIQNLEKLLPTIPVGIPRKRRGLISFGGQILKYLFDTATGSEVQELQSVVSRYEDQNEDIIHVAKSQLTLLKTVDMETN